MGWFGRLRGRSKGDARESSVGPVGDDQQGSLDGHRTPAADGGVWRTPSDPIDTNQREPQGDHQAPEVVAVSPPHDAVQETSLDQLVSAEQALRAGDHAAAAESAERALAGSAGWGLGTAARGHYVLGIALLSLERAEEGIAHVERASHLGEGTEVVAALDKAAAFVGRGMQALGLPDAQAVWASRAAGARDPDGYLQLLEIAFDEEDWESVSAWGRRWLAIKPGRRHGGEAAVREMVREAESASGAEAGAARRPAVIGDRPRQPRARSTARANPSPTASPEPDPAWTMFESAMERGAWAELLSALDEPGSGAELRRWYWARRAHWESRRDDREWATTPGLGAGDDEWERAGRAEIVTRLGRRLARMLFAVALLEPRDAAGVLAAESAGRIARLKHARYLLWLDEPLGDPAGDLDAVRTKAACRGRAWVTACVKALADVRAEAGEQRAWLASLAARLVLDGDAGADATLAAVEAAVAVGAWESLLGLLDVPAGGAVGQQVRRWQSSRLGAWTKQIAEDDSSDARESAGCLCLLVSSLADPAVAVRTYVALARRHPWKDDALREAARRMRARGDRWCVDFFVEAERVEAGWSNDGWMGGVLGELWLDLARDGLVGPLPTWRALREAIVPWSLVSQARDVLGGWHTKESEQLARLPLAVELIAAALRDDLVAARALMTAYLLDGWSKVGRPDLVESLAVPAAYAALAHEGALDRDSVLDTTVAAIGGSGWYGGDQRVRSMLDALDPSTREVSRRLPQIVEVLTQAGAGLAPLAALVVEVCSEAQLTALLTTTRRGFQPPEPLRFDGRPGSLDDPSVVREWAGGLYSVASGAWLRLGPQPCLSHLLAAASDLVAMAKADPVLLRRLVALVADEGAQPGVRDTVMPVAVALLRREGLAAGGPLGAGAPVLAEFRTGLAVRVLVPLLRREPGFADVLAAVLGDPEAFLVILAGSSPEPATVLLASLTDMIREGSLDRERQLSALFGLLTRQLTPEVSKAAVRLLGAFGFSTSDAVERMPLLLGILPTVHASVAAALRPVMLEAVSAADLPSLAGVLCARTEKAGHTLLVRVLTAKTAIARWGDGPVAEALAVVSGLTDESVAARARKALGISAGAVAARVADLWRPVPTVVDQPRPVTPIEPTEKGLATALSRIRARTTTADPAVFLDAAVRWAASDLDAAVSWGVEAARKAGGALSWAPGALWMFRGYVSPLLRVTLKDVSDELERPGLVARRYSKLGLRGFAAKHAEKVLGSRGRSWLVAAAGGYVGWHRHGEDALHSRFLAEIEMRLGEIPYLVSTPTHNDGGLDFDTLVQRLRGYGDLPVGPLDLLLALLRLDTPPVDRAADADGIQAVLWTAAEYLEPGLRSVDADGSREDRDAVHGWLQSGGARALPVSGLVRDWILGGGRPALTGRLDGSDVALDTATLPVPVPLGDFAGAPAGLIGEVRPSTDRWASFDGARVETDLGVVPRWSDRTAVRYRAAFGQKRRGATRGVDERWLGRLAEAPSPGLGTLRGTIATLNHPDEDLRLAGVDAALLVMGRGYWPPEDATAITLALVASGDLKLARVAHSFEQVILGGGLQLLWPTALAILDAAASAERRPVGLSELTRMLRRYVAAVPREVMPEVPASIARLAAAAGTTAQKLEAAAFVAAVNGRSA